MFQYLNWYVRYTKNTQLHLRKLLKSYVSRAENDLESPLDADCARTLGILLALDDHIDHFAVSIGASGEEAEKTEKSSGFGGCWNRQHGKRAIAMDLRTDSCPLHGHI